MNRTNILGGIKLLQFAIMINEQMITNGHALTGKPFTEEEVKELQEEILAAEESIDVLEKAIREDQIFENQADGVVE